MIATPRTCVGCGEVFLGRGRAKWCSGRCRKSQYGDPCVDCGARTRYGRDAARVPEPHCDDCRKRRQSARHDDRVREVVALREQGLLNHEIAERLGVTVATVAMLVSNGRRLGRVEVPDTPYDIVAMVRERARRRREKVERLWAEGLTCRQIAEAMGWYVANAGRHVSALRSVGYNLPYRSHEHRSRVAREARLRYLARQRAAA